MRRLPARPRCSRWSLVPAAGAHPLGNFTVNQYARIQVAAPDVQVHFVLDQAEIPTLQMIQARDADGSGQIDGAETATVRDALVRDITGAISLTVDGRRRGSSPAGATLAFPAGPGRPLDDAARPRPARRRRVSSAATPQQIAYTSDATRPTASAGRRSWSRGRPAPPCTATTAATRRPHERPALVPEGRARLAGVAARATVDARLGDGGLASAPCETDGNVAAAEAGRDHTAAGSSRWSTRAGR